MRGYAGALSARRRHVKPRHRRIVYHAGNPAVIGNPLDRWLCDPLFREVCLFQLQH